MNRAVSIVFVIMVGFFLIITSGCAKTAARKTGFLSDYSRLEPSEDSLRYINMKRLGNYSQFIVEPVVVYLHGVPQGKRPDRETQKELANYLHNAIVDAISDRYMIVSQPAPGVAKLRVAITDVEKSSAALNILPQTKMTGLGLGGASMEGEVLDSRSGEQIGAVIQSQKGKRLSMSGIKKWGDAKAVMDEWAKRFRERLDEAHGN